MNATNSDRPAKRYRSLPDYLTEYFGGRLYKVTIDAGFTCPNRDGSEGDDGCIYCDPETLRLAAPGATLSITEQIDKGVKSLRKRYKKSKSFIAYFQINTNTYAPISKLRSLYEEAVGHPDISAIAVSTRPDCVPDEVIDLLCDIKESKPLWLELGLQSSKDATLDAINRGHSAEDFADATRRAAASGIDVCGHIILGLPGETRDDMVETARFVASLPVWGIKFHQLQVVAGTPLEKLYENENKRSLPLSLDEYADVVVDCLEVLNPAIVVHRLVGDTPRRMLVAPRWGVDKGEVIKKIESIMEERDTFQGALYKEKT
jgi:hypothetical protein